jgi:hypothetical protein
VEPLRGDIFVFVDSVGYLNNVSFSISPHRGQWILRDNTGVVCKYFIEKELSYGQQAADDDIRRN